jgi:ABC-2 type transport system permease protein
VNPRRIYADFKVFSRGYLRNSAALFFSLFFPIILIVLFGAIFSGSTSATTLYVENFDGNSNATAGFLAALNATGAISVDVIPLSDGNLSHWLGNNSDPVGLVIPKGFAANVAGHQNATVVLYTNPEDAAISGIALGVVQGVANAVNLQLVHASAVVGVSDQNVGSTLYTSIDYLVPGLIGFSVLTSPMFSMVEISSSYKKERLFRQLSLTPLTKAEWLTSKLLWFVGLSFISAAIMITIGLLVFNGHFVVTWEIIPFLFVGPLFFVALGMLAGSLTKTPETAAIIGNVITFPMMFLSGTFFPVADFPPFLQTFARVLPLYYVIDGMNQVMLFGNVARALFDFAVIGILAVIVFVAAIVVFQWRGE